jgi:transcriptional regulator with XRE-family HTH domain
MPADRSLPCWAQRLTELRRARTWSPADLARELKKRRDDLPSARSLAHMIQLDWETGKHRPGPRYRLLLAAVYDLDEQQIFGDEDLMDVPHPGHQPKALADLAAVLDDCQQAAHAEVESGATLVSVLAEYAPGTELELPAPPADITVLEAGANRARRYYQACQYTELIRLLPQLLLRLRAASTLLDGEAKSRALIMSADAYHVAAGLLLKLDDRGLAHLAADRSMQAAQASQDPITVGASARIITHALMRGGHLAVAASTASRHAARLDHDVSSHSPESLSVYGSLLLRGAIAAAQDGRRGTAHELLDESDAAAQRLDADANLRWTAFGPTNVKLHRVSAAVTLGDAGTALEIAREIDPATIIVTERKARLLVDISRAFLQWGRHDKAYTALRAAEHAAHEEVAGRPSVHRLVRELIGSAPPTIRRDAIEFATHIGVTS